MLLYNPAFFHQRPNNHFVLKDCCWLCILGCQAKFVHDLVC